MEDICVYVSIDILVSVLRPFSQYEKCKCFIYNFSQKRFKCWILKLKVSNEIKHYVKMLLLYLINVFEQVFPMWAAMK